MGFHAVLRRARSPITWVLLAGLYLVFALKTGAQELEAAAASALAVALFLLALRRATRRAPWPKGAMRIVAGALAAAVRDSVRVGAALARALFARSVPAGAFERQAYAFHKGPAGRARAALHIAAISLAPNSFVAGIEADALVLHRLVRREGKAE